MDNYKRALRRYHAARVKQRFAREVRATQYWREVEELDHWVQRHWQHRARCSCAMCGNPRRLVKGDHRLTMQERRADGER